MAVMFNFTSDMKKRLEAEKLSIQKKAQSALTQDQFEVCDKIITLAADTASAQTDDLIKMIGSLALLWASKPLKKMHWVRFVTQRFLLKLKCWFQYLIQWCYHRINYGKHKWILSVGRLWPTWPVAKAT